MKKMFLLLLVSASGFTASGQTANDLAVAATDRERERINTERLALEASFDAEEALCYKKFFVNSCLNAIKPRRREVMAELRLREVALNDQTRMQKAAEQIRKTEEKSSLEVQQQAIERRAKSLEDDRARGERTLKKVEERLDLKQNEATSAAEAANKMKGSQERAKARVDKQAAIAGEVEKYNDKQDEVTERKANREKRQREQTKPAAKPLPAPG